VKKMILILAGVLTLSSCGSNFVDKVTNSAKSPILATEPASPPAPAPLQPNPDTAKTVITQQPPSTTPAPRFIPIENGSYTTEFDPSIKGRTHNLRKSAGVIDGKILQPGEIFSFNETVGPAGKDDGYMLARYVLKGEWKEGYGGGICQVSSTIYNAADGAGMKIVERVAHSKRVDYVPKDRDAAAAWGSVDLKFKNTESTPIRINCKIEGNKLTVTLSKIV